MMYCSMTGRPLHSTSDGIYDDGEWISWEWINSHIANRELQAQFKAARPETIGIFFELCNVAQSYHAATGRYLQIWGELGEVFAEIAYGIERHAPGTQGSDGRLGDDWVEIKTISPEKGPDSFVQVKTAGNFNKLLIVRIDEDFNFDSWMMPREKLSSGGGAYIRIRLKSIAGKPDFSTRDIELYDY